MELKHIDFLILGNDEVTLGRVDLIHCPATASDESQCLAMLIRAPDDLLISFFERLDTAIEDAMERGIYTDEINV